VTPAARSDGRGVVYPQPSSNISAVLRSRESYASRSAEPAEAAAAPTVAAAPSHASRAASVETTQSNVTALLRSQAGASRFEQEDEIPPDDYDDDDSAGLLPQDDSGDDVKPPKRKRGFVDVLLLVLALLLIVGGAGYGAYTFLQNKNLPATEDMLGNLVRADDTSMYDPAVIKQADAVDDVGLRFIIDSVKLNVPLGEVNEVNGNINPPGFKTAYRIRNRGVTLADADKGTVYVAAHSLRGAGMAPGNYVIDKATGTIIVPYGATIKVGDRTYVMTSSEVIDKNDLGSDTKLWANTPGMLVFITCMEYTDPSKYKNGKTPDNAIIIGQLVS